MIQMLHVNRPRISIVMPTFNRAQFLPMVISSILQQSFTDFELIIVDDSSSDNSEEIISSFNDERILYIRQSRNRGEYATTNLGIRAASGMLVTWVHSDDILPQDSLATRVRCLDENPDVDLCHGDISIIDEQGEVIGFYPAFSGSGGEAFEEYYKPAESRICEFPIHHTTIMFRREFIHTTGYWDERLPCVGDTEWLLRALKFGKIKKAPGILYLYRSHPATKRVHDAKNGRDVNVMLTYVKPKVRKFCTPVEHRSDGRFIKIENIGSQHNLELEHIDKSR